MILVLDENFKPWLIEVNRCPSMACDNPVLERMVPEMIENMIKIVVDNKLENKPLNEKNRFIHYNGDKIQTKPEPEVSSSLPLTHNTSILSLLIS